MVFLLPRTQTSLILSFFCCKNGHEWSLALRARFQVTHACFGLITADGNSKRLQRRQVFLSDSVYFQK